MKMISMLKTKQKIKSLIILTFSFTFLSTACTFFNEIPETTLRRATTSNLFEQVDNVYFNPVFGLFSINDNFSSVIATLLTWANPDVQEMNEKTAEIVKPAQSYLEFEAATKLEVFGTEKEQTEETKTETSLIAIEKNNNKRIDFEDLNKKIVNASKIVFTLNEEMKWVDNYGNSKQTLAPKDFWSSLKALKFSGDINYNNNSYFIDLIGLDYDKTVEDSNNQSTIPGGTFTYYFNNPNPAAADIFTKPLFAPIPHSHPEVPNILDQESSLGKGIVLDKDKSISVTETNWSKIFGAGPEQATENPDAWFIGSYYVKKVTSQDIIFKPNKFYFKANNQFGNLESKIPEIILSFSKAYPNADAIYDGFLNNQLNYVTVPPNKIEDAIRRYANTNYYNILAHNKVNIFFEITYNMGIYDSHGKRKSNISELYEKFVKDFNGEGLKIRRAINKSLNWSQISRIALKGYDDFNFSAIPFGNLFDNTDPKNPKSQYQIIAEKGSVNGVKIKGIIDDYSKMVSAPISGVYLLPEENITQYREEMKTALENLGASQNNPLVLNYLYRSSSLSSERLASIRRMNEAIESLSNGLIKMDFTPRSPTTQSIYNSQNFTISNFGWAPDYVGAGTWIEIWFYYNFNKEHKPMKIPGEHFESKKGIINVQPAFSVPNLYPLLFNEMKEVANSNNSQTQDTDASAKSNKRVFTEQEKTWLKSLWDFLIKRKTIDENDIENFKDSLAPDIGIWTQLDNKNAFNLAQWIDNQHGYIPTPTGAGYSLRDTVLYNKKIFKITTVINGTSNPRDWSLVK